MDYQNNIRTFKRNLGIENYVSLEVELLDVNDNAPYLDMPEGLVWYENQGPGEVGDLVADDNDNSENGPPFTFTIAAVASREIDSMFGVEGKGGGRYVLTAKRRFDREHQKEYKVPVKICDHKQLCGVSDLKVIIGDRNDNKMESGFSEILVYNYEGRAPETDIGRVYVKDPDDWDLPDKNFDFKEPHKWDRMFGLDRNTGVIKMRSIRFSEDESILRYSLDFKVEDPTHDQVNTNAVPATVNITVKKISKEAVLMSGSVRIAGIPEDFIRPDADGYSKRDRFGTQLQRKLNATHLDVFTVLPAQDGAFTGMYLCHGLEAKRQ